MRIFFGDAFRPESSVKMLLHKTSFVLTCLMNSLIPKGMQWFSNCIQAPLALYRVMAVSFRKLGSLLSFGFVENRCFFCPQKPSAETETSGSVKPSRWRRLVFVRSSLTGSSETHRGSSWWKITIWRIFHQNGDGNGTLFWATWELDANWKDDILVIRQVIFQLSILIDHFTYYL